MTGEKNRFKTTEKLWDLDDKQLKSPVHDAMVLWLMEEENAKKILEPITAWSTYNDFMSSEDLDVETYKIRSEIPLQAQNGFINGYADLEISRHQTTKEKYYECKVSEEVLELVKAAGTVGDLKNILREKYKFTEFEPSLKERYYCKGYSSNDKPLEEWGYYSDYSHSVLELKLVDFFNNFTGYPSSMATDELLHWICGNNYYKYKTNHIKCLIEVKPYIDSFGAVLRQINSYKSFWNPRTYSNVAECICLFTFDDQFDKQFESQGIIMLHPPVSQDEMLDMYGLR